MPWNRWLREQTDESKSKHKTTDEDWHRHRVPKHVDCVASWLCLLFSYAVYCLFVFFFSERETLFTTSHQNNITSFSSSQCACACVYLCQTITVNWAQRNIWTKLCKLCAILCWLCAQVRVRVHRCGSMCFVVWLKNKQMNFFFSMHWFFCARTHSTTRHTYARTNNNNNEHTCVPLSVHNEV